MNDLRSYIKFNKNSNPNGNSSVIQTQLPNQDINLDEVLKTMCTVEGAT